MCLQWVPGNLSVHSYQRQSLGDAISFILQVHTASTTQLDARAGATGAPLQFMTHLRPSGETTCLSMLMFPPCID